MKRTVKDNANDIYNLQGAVVELKKHAEVSNKEMGLIQIHIASLDTQSSLMKEIMEKLDNRTWMILSGVIVSILMTIVGLLIKFL